MNIEQCPRCKKEIDTWESHHVAGAHYYKHDCACGYIVSQRAEAEGSIIPHKLHGIEKKIEIVGTIRPAKPKYEHVGEPKPLKGK